MKKTAKYSSACLLALCAVLRVDTALAIDGVKINGFMTAAATALDSKGNQTWDGLVENKIGFTDSRLGLQFIAKVNPQVEFNGQLLAEAKEDNYNVHTDWAYINYRPIESLQVRAGLNKLPNFLISDYQFVGYAYPWIRPPQEVYSQNPLESASGVDLIFTQSVGDFQLMIQPYFGHYDNETVVPQDAIINYPGMLSAFTVGQPDHIGVESDPVRGLTLSVSTDAFTVRAGYQDAIINVDFNTPSEGDSWRVSTLGFNMDWRNIVVYSEYFQRKVGGAANVVLPDQKGYYATVGYRFGKFLPIFTASKLDDNGNPTGPNSGTPLKQTSRSLGLRYELGDSTALKFEATQSKPQGGTRGLFVAVPDKSTVMIYGVSLDVVF
ncbi:MAG TPA: porin [Candidatus Methylomirabilis sp.]|nr:porin [Candidatus Methylomirabilis sp.]